MHIDSVALSAYFAMDVDPPEFVLPSYLAHWSVHCPHELQEDSILVFSVSSHKTDIVIEREFAALTPQEVKDHREGCAW